jgi:hypothetical protein
MGQKSNCDERRETNPWSTLTSFSLMADHFLIYELKDAGSKPVQHVIEMMKKFYTTNLTNPDYRKVSLLIKQDYGSPDEFAMKVLGAAEKGKLIKKVGDNYELGEAGIRIANRPKRRSHKERYGNRMFA